MKNKCTKCDKELASIYDWGYCYDCKKKKNRKEAWICVGIVILVLSVIFGIRYAYAKIIYNDARCIFAECRIMK